MSPSLLTTALVTMMLMSGKDRPKWGEGDFRANWEREESNIRKEVQRQKGNLGSQGNTLSTEDVIADVYRELHGRVQHEGRTFLTAAHEEIHRVLYSYVQRRQKDEGRLKSLSATDIESEILTPSEANYAEYLAIREALEELAEKDPEQGRVARMRAYDRMKIEDIATEIGRPVQHVQDLLTLIRQKLGRKFPGGLGGRE